MSGRCGKREAPLSTVQAVVETSGNLSGDPSGSKHKLVDRLWSGNWGFVVIVTAARRFRALLIRRRLDVGQSIQHGVDVLARIVVIMRP
jgi:hypothetical protein